MQSTPKISVLMVCYNHEKYVVEAIESILSQTHQDFELVVVDDGSTDKTLNLIQRFEDPRINVLTQKNSGPSIALNAGLDRCRGEYIAFMSGDDMSLPSRLISQLRQIQHAEADMVFCLPEIVGPSSQTLGWEVCPWFFGKEFTTTAELFRVLFHSGNFLCAPSAFCRRTAIERVGHFKRGLVQLQDFDYWIRACKRQLVIKSFRDPLIRYRHLYGMNLSDRTNLPRVRVEQMEIYRGFLDGAPLDLLRDAFGNDMTVDPNADCLDVEIVKSMLLLDHSDPLVKAIGAERIIGQLEDDQVFDRLLRERSFDLTAFFKATKDINLESLYAVGRSKRLLRSVRTLVADSLRTGIETGPLWTRTQVEQRIRRCLEEGDHHKAIALTRGPRVLRSKSNVKSVLRKVLVRSRKQLVGLSARIDPFVDRVIRAQYAEVFPLARMYDYCKQAELIVHEQPPERVYLDRPKLVGADAANLPEGNAICPIAYVSALDNAVITGGSSLVISQDGILLSDEMVDFPGEDFGIKSPYVRFRHKDKAILGYLHRPYSRIKEGILLSCDHDMSYFHWLVECLPKLVLIDGLGRFKDVPVLVPKGLHKNLEAALDKTNTSGRPIVRLDSGLAYHVDRLVFPSALSRIVDRYLGKLAFDTDIVLSKTWISKVRDRLADNVGPGKRPWRRLFLTRRKGLRLLGNLEEVEQTLLERQFEIVEMDDIPLRFQIELLSQASIVVAPTGAALTNMLFCQPGTEVVVFMSNHEISNYYLWPQLGNIAEVDVEIIVGERMYNLTDYYSVHDDYTVDVRAVAERVGKHAQVQISGWHPL